VRGGAVVEGRGGGKEERDPRSFSSFWSSRESSGQTEEKFRSMVKKKIGSRTGDMNRNAQ